MSTTSTAVIHPGLAQPFPPCTQADLARFLHVPLARIQPWVDAGMECSSDGRIDPFAAVNWLSWGRLAECPVLARRWRTYLAWFMPFVAGLDRPRSFSWVRRHRLYLPHIVDRLEWFLPGPLQSSRQCLVKLKPLAGHGLVREAVAGGEVLRGQKLQTAAVRGSVDLIVHPQAPLSPHDADWSELCALLQLVAGEFRYAYRRHQLGEYARIGTGQVEAQWQGSCIDCVMVLGALLTQRGRPWRLCAGVVAKSAIANPHFWLETRIADGWITLDPTLPAIVRMLGGDWQSYVRAYTGGCDARRVTLRLDAQLADVPGGMSLFGAGGEVVAIGTDGTRRNALPCSDWICGECSHQFESRAV